MFRKSMLILLLSACCFGQIHFPDPKFKEYLVNGSWLAGTFEAWYDAPYDLNGDGEISVEEAAWVTGPISILGSEITDITGIEHFSNLQGLGITGTGITSLPKLPASLRSLNCSRNALTTLRDLSETSITHLQFNANQITELPPLPQTLRSLSCDANLLENVDSLGAFPSLEFLACSDNLLTELPDLHETNLWKLEVSGNRLSSLPQLPPGLEVLDCSRNQLSALPAIPELTHLDCDGNRLSSLPDFAPGLRRLVCNDNQLTVLPALPDTLNVLQCRNNRLTEVPDLTRAEGLQECFLEGNQLDTSACSMLGVLQQLPYVKLTFQPQADGELACPITDLRALIPWIVTDEQWTSRIAIFNAGNETVDVELRAMSNNIPGLATVQVGAQSVTVIEDKELFPYFPHYGVALYSTSSDLHVTYQTFNRETDSGRSPSQTNALVPADIQESIVFPYLPGDMTTALTFWAPFTRTHAFLDLQLHDEHGGLVAETVFRLPAGQVRAIILAELFPEIGLPDHGAVIVRARDQVRIAGIAYSFNASGEPAMSKAIPLKK